jgi:hypothetical protein
MNRRRRGFAMIYALTILGLVAMALYVLAAHFSFEMHRTNNTQTDAQLHQLLLAGNDFVTAEAAKWPEQIEFKLANVAVPTAPVDTKITAAIKLLSSEAGVAKVEVSADRKPQNAVENLTLKFSDGHWHLTGAELIGE